MNSKEQKPLESVSRKTTPETRLNEQEILDLIAEVSHKTWMKQANRDKGTPLDRLSPEVSNGDRDRAADAWRALETEKPKTRAEAVTLLASRSHEMWLDFKRVQVTLEKLDPNPNDHDRERAEDIIKALEIAGIPLSFGK